MSEKIEVKNIYQRVNQVMRECEYVKKGKADKGAGVLYDEVISIIRRSMVENGIVVVVRCLNFHCSGELKTGNQKIYQASYEMDLVNIDNPSDHITHTITSQGMDGGDKGPGKAQTYAVKCMLVKAFLLESGINEESRVEIEEKKTITQEQYNNLYNYCLCVVDQSLVWTSIGQRISRHYGIDILDELPKNKYEEVLRLCKAQSSIEE